VSAILKIVFDNRAAKPGLQPGDGFACAFETQDGLLLFDTGSDAEILFSNMENMWLDPAQINTVVLSHSHWDHIGGLEKIPLKSLPVTIHLPPDNVPLDLSKHLRAIGAEVFAGEDGREIIPGFFLVHSQKNPWREQSLIITHDGPAVILTGCAHPGIVEVVKMASDKLGYLEWHVVGGLHMRGEAVDEFRKIARELKGLGVVKIAPAHCTDNPAREVLRETFGDNFIETGLGSVIHLD